MSAEKSKIRIRIILMCVVLVFLVLATRLYMIQVIHADTYKNKAISQYDPSLEDIFDRGSIYFSTKSGEIVSGATNKDGYFLALEPKHIEKPDELYNAISAVVSLSRAEYDKHISNKDDPYEVVLHQITDEQASELKKIDLKGFSLYPERWRYYPGKSLASQVLGFTGYNDNGYSGRYGIERQYNSILERSNDFESKNAFVSLFSDFAKRISSPEKSEGDIVLTIEPSVEAYTEEVLKKTVEQFSPKEAGIIVMSPQDGSIYAMAGWPNFDPNDYSKVADISVFQNPLVEKVYEMGSIVKPLTVSSGLDAGVITATTTYDDRGHATYDGSTISNYDGRARGVVPIQQILSQSLNVGVAWIMEQLTPARLSAYFKSFGMGEKTGIELPNESSGLISNLDSKGEIGYATAAFGQGIALTPIQTIRALASLGNGGFLVTPHVVKKIDYKVGTDKVIEPKKVQVIKKETSDEITNILIKVVDEALLRGAVKLDHYTVAAKTGTAQIPTPNGGYSKSVFLHSFFGYFPAYNPQFIILLYMKEPQHVEYASESLTLPFFDIAKFLINYYNLPPDR